MGKDWSIRCTSELRSLHGLVLPVVLKKCVISFVLVLPMSLRKPKMTCPSSTISGSPSGLRLAGFARTKSARFLTLVSRTIRTKKTIQVCATDNAVGPRRDIDLTGA